MHINNGVGEWMLKNVLGASFRRRADGGGGGDSGDWRWVGGVDGVSG